MDEPLIKVNYKMPYNMELDEKYIQYIETNLNFLKLCNFFKIIESKFDIRKILYKLMNSQRPDETCFVLVI